MIDSAQEIRALKLIRVALLRGCAVSLYPGDDLKSPYVKDSVDFTELSDVVMFERVTVVCSRGRASGATFFLVFGGGEAEAPFRAYSRNHLGRDIYTTVWDIAVG